MTILLTGFTGNVGLEIARQLAGHRVLALVRDANQAPRFDGVALIEGSLESLPAAVQPDVETIVHCAASTAFKAPLAELRRTNVDGTASLLAFARGCRRLRKFVHVSTTCVCGDATGCIVEAPVADAPRFVNAYEQSKWEAEQLVLASGLPVEIARLAIVAGSERDGSVRRPGAVHHALYWLYKGLIPMIPGTLESRVDLISTEFAAGVIAALVRDGVEPGRIVHASAGNTAPMLGELLDFLAEFFSRHHRGWASGAVTRPDVVDAQTFALFEAAVRQSGDLIFQRVCDNAQSFLPGLLYPRAFATSFARSVPLAGWRALAGAVVSRLVESDWARKSKPALCHDAA
jgi:nucleoside-diphosphate-sugar epimerase